MPAAKLKIAMTRHGIPIAQPGVHSNHGVAGGFETPSTILRTTLLVLSMMLIGCGGAPEGDGTRIVEVTGVVEGRSVARASEM